VREIRRARELELGGVEAEILCLEEEEYRRGLEIPAPCLDARVLDVLRELRVDECAVARGRREGLGLLDRLVALAAFGVELEDDIAVELAPGGDVGLGEMTRSILPMPIVANKIRLAMGAGVPR
jgi:hypothetical protein